MRNKIYNPYKQEILDLLSSLDIEVNNLTEIENTVSESSDNTEEKSKTSSAAKENKDFSKYFIFIAAIIGIMIVSYFAGRKSIRDDIETKVSNDSEIISYSVSEENSSTTPENTENNVETRIYDDSETSSYNETSEMFSEENSSITYQSTENSSESEIPDDSETSLCSETTEIVSQISTETNENKETGSQLYETAHIEDNFFIRTFFSDDAISKIKGESDNGEHLVDVSDFVELDSNGDVKSICKNEINISEGEWKSRDYRGDYVKNSNKISLRATVDNNDNKKDVVKIEFRIDIEENQFYVYMILDD